MGVLGQGVQWEVKDGPVQLVPNVVEEVMSGNPGRVVVDLTRRGINNRGVGFPLHLRLRPLSSSCPTEPSFRNRERSRERY